MPDLSIFGQSPRCTLLADHQGSGHLRYYPLGCLDLRTGTSLAQQKAELRNPAEITILTLGWR